MKGLEGYIDGELYRELIDSQTDMQILDSGAVSVSFDEAREIIQRNRVAWDRVIEELGLDPDGSYVIDSTRGAVFEDDE